MMSQTCLNFLGTRFVPMMDAHLKKNCDFARFGRKIKINRNVVGLPRNFPDPLDVFLVRCLQKTISKFDL